MADTHEADRPGLNAAEAVRELFAQLPVPGKDVVWLADQVLGIAQHLGSIELERVRDGEEHALVGRTDTEQQVIGGGELLRLFRPLLARFAVLGADETGGEPRLYGGTYSLSRSSRTGPVRLEIVFVNTPGGQTITITRVPIGVAPRTGAADVPAPSTAPHLSA